MEIEESSNEPPLRLRKSNEFNSFFLSFFPIVIVVAGSSFSYFSPFDILSSTSSSFSFSPNSFRCAQRNAPILYLVSAFLPPLFLDRYMCVVEPFFPPAQLHGAGSVLLLLLLLEKILFTDRYNGGDIRRFPPLSLFLFLVRDKSGHPRTSKKILIFLLLALFCVVVVVVVGLYVGRPVDSLHPMEDWALLYL